MQQSQTEQTKFNHEVYEKNIKALITEHFPVIARLDELLQVLIIEQLMWVQQYSKFTPQANVLYDQSYHYNQHLHIETFRAMTRIEQLVLLNSDDGNYQDFVRFQPQGQQLSEGGYQQLKEQLRVSKNELHALIRATLIASVPLSPPAKQFLAQHHPDKQYPYDSVQFSGFTVQLCPQMYPAYQTATQDVQQLIRHCFPVGDAHWRHMFYLENTAAFKALAESKMSPEQLQFWQKYWLVNIVGMDGHLTKNAADKTHYAGAIYYTQSVHDRAMWLNNAMKKDLANVSKDYSSIMLSELEIKTDAPTATFLCRILTMTNRISEADAQGLYKALQSMDAELVRTMVDAHTRAFGRVELRVTYLPALLGNVWQINHSDASLIQCMHLASQLALQHDSGNPLSFRVLKDKNVRELMAANFDIGAVTMEDNGEISFNEEFQLGPRLEQRQVLKSQASLV